VFSIFDNYQKIREEKNAIKIDKFKSNIVFKNVSFKYEDNSDNNILDNISVKIKKGETVAIVGESGAGKSTFSELIPRLYDVTKGELLLDDINIKKYALKDLRNLISVVTQNTILFNDTIKYNISYSNNKVSDNEVFQAIKSANLDNLINHLPNGINTIIGENGVKLSGGEKQRLSIARAIIKNPKVLILDEATASLDSDSEKKVHEAIDNIIKDRTVIIIAHRLSTIVNADKILVIQKGRIIDQGTHDELLENSNIYKNLYELQMGSLN
jgi:ABC-type multidrug transport system fused ATPase/permease subunit